MKKLRVQEEMGEEKEIKRAFHGVSRGIGSTKKPNMIAWLFCDVAFNLEDFKRN